MDGGSYAKQRNIFLIVLRSPSLSVLQVCLAGGDVINTCMMFGCLINHQGKLAGSCGARKNVNY